MSSRVIRCLRVHIKSLGDMISCHCVTWTGEEKKNRYLFLFTAEVFGSEGGQGSLQQNARLCVFATDAPDLV